MEYTGKTERPGRRSRSCPTRTSRRSILVETLVQRLSETAFLTKGLAIVLMDLREGEDRYEFKYEAGIRDFVGYIDDSKGPRSTSGSCTLSGRGTTAPWSAPCKWNCIPYVECVFSFANEP